MSILGVLNDVIGKVEQIESHLFPIFTNTVCDFMSETCFYLFPELLRVW